jgi:putative Ca2+/H+ antiporter (TMEM165/GDT1 family)
VLDLAVVGSVFVVIFLGELPDKTMFASLVLASRGRPLAVWCGAAAAFTVHVVIAVTAGGLLSLAPERVVDLIAAVLFAGGAVYAFRDTGEEEAEKGLEAAAQVASPRRTALTAFVVIFVAEWGDLTQILTANLAARDHDPLSVGVGAVLALWTVAALAVIGSRFLARLPMTVIRRVTGTVLAVLAVVSLVQAIRA